MILIEDTGNTLIVEGEEIVISYIAEQGAPGSVSGGGNSVEHIAAIALSGNRAVYVESDGLRYADSSLPLTAVNCIGLTKNATSAGSLSIVQIQDLITEPSWNWIPGKKVYLSTLGNLTQVPPLTGVQVQIGIAKSPTSLIVEIQPGITLI
ncbi:MAG: hypothetical protein ACRDBG_00700 [Waterburya sp.]